MGVCVCACVCVCVCVCVCYKQQREQFRSVPFGPFSVWVVRGHEGQFSRDPLPVFSAGGHCERFWYGQGCPLFDVVHPAFSPPIMALPTLQGGAGNFKAQNFTY